jgi:hypothetical protein
LSSTADDMQDLQKLLGSPTLLPGWRIAPILTMQISLNDASLDFMGTKLNVPDEVKPHAGERHQRSRRVAGVDSAD